MAKLKATTVTGSLEVSSNTTVKGNLTVEGTVSTTGGLNAGQLKSGTVPLDRLQKASTTAIGVSQLNDATNSNSTTQAATANAVKKTYDRAETKLPLAGGTLTGTVTSNVGTGTDILKWSSANDKNFLRKLTNQGGLGISSDSSLFLHAGDTSATIMADAGAKADLTSEDLHLMADSMIKMAVFTQDGYAGASKFHIDKNGWNGNVVGNSSTTTKWANARTITLGGDLTGNVSIDGSSNVTLNAEVKDSSHNHSTLTGPESTTIFRDHGNGNVTLAATKNGSGTIGDLYIGYNSGTAHVTNTVRLCRTMNWNGGHTLVDSNGKIPWAALTGLPSTWAPSSHTHPYVPTDTTDFVFRAKDTTLSAKIIGSGSDRTCGIYGTYDSYKIGHIWSMGNSYKIAADGSNFGNLYGIAYKHTNNTTGGTMASGHQMLWVSNGTPKCALGDNIWTSGRVNGASASFSGDVSVGGILNVKTTGINFNNDDKLTYDDSGNYYQFGADNNATAGKIKAGYAALGGAGMTGNISFSENNQGISWSRNSDGASITFKNDSDADTDSFLQFKTLDNGNEYFKWVMQEGSTNHSVMWVKKDDAYIRGRVDMAGGQKQVHLKCHENDHGYISFYTNKSNANTRTAYMGFGSSGSTVFNIQNERGSDIQLQGHLAGTVTWSTGGPSGSPRKGHIWVQY